MLATVLLVTRKCRSPSAPVSEMMNADLVGLVDDVLVDRHPGDVVAPLVVDDAVAQPASGTDGRGDADVVVLDQRLDQARRGADEAEPMAMVSLSMKVMVLL